MNLHYEQYGEAEQSIIILHGLFGSADNWTSLGKQLGRSYKTYLIDQRNHGKSPHDNEWTYESMANDLKEFMYQHKITSPVIIGHSMGGKTAMKFASLFPDLLDKLIVVDIAPKYYPVHHTSILAGLNAVDKQVISSRKEADSILSEYIPELPVRQFLSKNLVRSDSGLKWRMNLAVIDQNIENIGEPFNEDQIVSTPTLFIRGANSDYIKDEDKSILLKHFPDSQLQTVENAGHWVHAEKPKEFLDLIHNYISQ